MQNTPSIEEKTESTHRVSKRLRVRLWIFLAISAVLVAIALYDVIRGDIAWWLSLLGMIGGIGIGYIFGRLVKVRWHPTKETVVTQMDAAGFLVIGAYIALSIGRNFLFEEWLSGAALTAFTLSFAAGILFGRTLGMQTSIVRMLKERE